MKGKIVSEVVTSKIFGFQAIDYSIVDIQTGNVILSDKDGTLPYEVRNKIVWKRKGFCEGEIIDLKKSYLRN